MSLASNAIARGMSLTVQAAFNILLQYAYQRDNVRKAAKVYGMLLCSAEDLYWPRVATRCAVLTADMKHAGPLMLKLKSSDWLE